MRRQSCVQTSDANDVNHPRGTTPRPAAVESNGVESLAADILDVVLAEARRQAGRQAGPPAVVSMSFEKVPVGDVALSCVEEKEERERRERESKQRDGY